MGKTKTAVLEGVKLEEQEQKETMTSKGVSSYAQKRQPTSRGKKYTEAKALVNDAQLYSISEAIELVKKMNYSKFDGTVELHVMLKKGGISKQIELPHTAGKTKVIEFADEKTVEKLKNGTVNFDVLLTTPQMMPKLVPFARLLGPRGLMPNPKNGTIVKSEKDAVKFSQKTVTIKTEKKAPLVHMSVGKVSQDTKEIEANIAAIFKALDVKQIVKAYITASMTPSVKLEI